MSDTTHNTVFEALAAFQGEVGNIKKDGKNPFLKNKYATRDAMIEETKALRAKHGIAIYQQVANEGVNTILAHKSGTIESGWKKIEPQVTKGLSLAQAEGVSITYTRRYQYAALLGLATEEDVDGQVGDNKNLQKPLDKKARVVQLLKSLDYEVTEPQTIKETILKLTQLDWKPENVDEIASRLEVIAKEHANA